MDQKLLSHDTFHTALFRQLLFKPSSQLSSPTISSHIIRVVKTYVNLHCYPRNKISLLGFGESFGSSSLSILL